MDYDPKINQHGKDVYSPGEANALLDIFAKVRPLQTPKNQAFNDKLLSFITNPEENNESTTKEA